MIGVKDNDPAQNQIDWASARRAAKQPGIAAIDGEDMLASAWGICSMERMISSIRHVLFFNGTDIFAAIILPSSHESATAVPIRESRPQSNATW
jgi:hypothetical protein